mgnify:CR=1 FL=1
MNKDKLILVHYINTGNLINTEIPTFIEKAVKKISSDKDEHLSYFIPIKGESRVECINPKLVGKDEYKIHLKRLEKAEKEFYKVIDEIKTKQR